MHLGRKDPKPKQCANLQCRAGKKWIIVIDGPGTEKDAEKIAKLQEKMASKSDRLAKAEENSTINLISDKSKSEKKLLEEDANFDSDVNDIVNAL